MYGTLLAQNCTFSDNWGYEAGSAISVQATLFNTRSKPRLARHTVKIMIRIDRPTENTNQSGVDTTWCLNISGPVRRTNCRCVRVLNSVECMFSMTLLPPGGPGT
jgi:hypothetical protein